MARKLILITYNGGPSNYLPGVEKDRKSYLGYFKSRAGGSYMSNEIVEFHNDPLLSATLLDATIHVAITKQNVKNLIVVFCGHGYDTPDHNTMMTLGPNCACSMSHFAKISQGACTLFIADCCRTVLPTINSMVTSVNPLFNIAYATKHGCFALENVNGGLYSQKLMRSGNLLQILRGRNNYSIDKTHDLTSIFVVKDSSRIQQPEIIGGQISQITFSYII